MKKRFAIILLADSARILYNRVFLRNSSESSGFFNMDLR